MTRKEKALEALGDGEAAVVGGTAWLWAHEDAAGSVDVLVVDEAGQMALANVLAVAPAARSLVLCGDPQRLEQPQQAAHPEGADVSALAHLLGGAHTVPEGGTGGSPRGRRTRARCWPATIRSAAPG